MDVNIKLYSSDIDDLKVLECDINGVLFKKLLVNDTPKFYILERIESFLKFLNPKMIENVYFCIGSVKNVPVELYPYIITPVCSYCYKNNITLFIYYNNDKELMEQKVIFNESTIKECEEYINHRKIKEIDIEKLKKIYNQKKEG